jgi:hypothetical protein
LGARGGGSWSPATVPAAARLGARRSSTFPSLRWPKLHDFRPGSITTAPGIDLGLQLGLEELGLRDPRLEAADIAGERRSSSYGLPKATRSGAKGPGTEGKAHQGFVVAGPAAEDGRRRWPCGGGGRVLADRRLQTGAKVLDGSDHFRGLLRRWRGG